jgi:hypothetical protein
MDRTGVRIKLQSDRGQCSGCGCGCACQAMKILIRFAMFRVRVRLRLLLTLVRISRRSHARKSQGLNSHVANTSRYQNAGATGVPNCLHAIRSIAGKPTLQTIAWAIFSLLPKRQSTCPEMFFIFFEYACKLFEGSATHVGKQEQSPHVFSPDCNYTQ